MIIRYNTTKRWFWGPIISLQINHRADHKRGPPWSSRQTFHDVFRSWTGVHGKWNFEYKPKRYDFEINPSLNLLVTPLQQSWDGVMYTMQYRSVCLSVTKRNGVMYTMQYKSVCLSVTKLCREETVGPMSALFVNICVYVPTKTEQNR